jgi:hypothetical protein
VIDIKSLISSERVPYLRLSAQVYNDKADYVVIGKLVPEVLALIRGEGKAAVGVEESA